MHAKTVAIIVVGVALWGVAWATVPSVVGELLQGSPELPEGPDDAQIQLLEARLEQESPDLSPRVLDAALSSMSCARKEGLVKGAGERWLTIIDYSLPSTEPRLWVLDLEKGSVAFRERVAHGKNTGGNQALFFSNEDGSHQSSIGLFRTAETYVGSNGYSLRLDGLEPGVNDRARERQIVIHGADYVSDAFIAKTGRIGRSWGCPALSQAVARPLIDTIQGGTLVFSWYPDPQWLSSSSYLRCPA
ncbi:MAG TPA: murein L,D-transpeptidase catalytic domain family protein [Myxococcota bacterium]|nr:murein L,D-transpeptidase catalytic domain family protein [Myxococcota bacterium]